jgi:hypothetical protein
MQGFDRLYDSGNVRVPRVTLAAKGNDIALVCMNGGAVRRIWHYSVAADDAVLTFVRN